MELDKSLFFKIKDMNCESRTLHDSDVSKEYVDGLKQQTKYIMNIPKNVSISSQKKYVNDILLGALTAVSARRPPDEPKA